MKSPSSSPAPAVADTVNAGPRSTAPRRTPMPSAGRLLCLAIVALFCAVLSLLPAACDSHPVHPHDKGRDGVDGVIVQGRVSQVIDPCPLCQRVRKSNKSKFSHIIQAVCKRDYAFGVKVVDLQPAHYVVEVFGVFRVSKIPLYLKTISSLESSEEPSIGEVLSRRHIAVHRNDSLYLSLNRPFSVNRHCSCPHLHVNKQYLIAGNVDLASESFVLGVEDFSRRWNNRTMTDVQLGLRLCPLVTNHDVM